MFDIRLLVAFVFLIFSVILIFTSQSRTNIVTTLIIIHLNLILFLSLVITNSDLFKEIILVLILYLIIVIFIVTNQREIVQKVKKIKLKRPSFRVILFASCACVFIFVASFILTKISFDKMHELRQESMSGDILVAEKFVNQDLINNRKKMRVAKNLHENYLLKHSSDVILIITFLTGVILLFSPNLYRDKK